MFQIIRKTTLWMLRQDITLKGNVTRKVLSPIHLNQLVIVKSVAGNFLYSVVVEVAESS